MRRTETPKLIWMKFSTLVDITDTVTYTNFGDHRLRGFWVAGVKFPPLPCYNLCCLYACFCMLTACVFLFCIFFSFFVYAAIEIFSMNKVDY